MAIGTTAALIGASVAGGAASAYAGSKAASAQSRAARDANETQRYIFDQNVELSEPWREAGANALAAMQFETGLGPRPGDTSNLEIIEDTVGSGRPGLFNQGQRTHYYVGDQRFGTREAAEAWLEQQPSYEYQGFKETPGYQFRLDEGNKAIERMAAARGLRLSGGTLKEAGRYADGLASQEYGNHYNRLAAMAGIGQSATAQQMNAGTNYANATSQNALAAGNARASGYMNTANAFTNTMGDIGGLMMMNQMGVFQ